MSSLWDGDLTKKNRDFLCFIFDYSRSKCLMEWSLVKLFQIPLDSFKFFKKTTIGLPFCTIAVEGRRLTDGYVR